MTWQIYTVLSILLFSLNNLFHRAMMREESSDPFAQTIMFSGIGGIFALIVALLRDGFHYQISLAQLPYIIVLLIFGTIAPIASFKALKMIESSENSILSSSQRLWALFGSFIFLGESFSLKRVIGTLIILTGIIISQWRKQKFVINLGVAYAFLAAFCYAIVEISSFYILRDFDTTSFAIYSCLIPVLGILLIKPNSFKKLGFYLKPRRAFNISIVSINDLLATIFVFSAYQVGRNASQIGPIMGTETIISVLLAIIILKEHSNIINKVLGAGFVVFGVILVL